MYVASYPADGNTSEKHVVYRISDLTNNPQPEKLVTVPGQYDGIAFASMVLRFMLQTGLLLGLVV